MTSANVPQRFARSRTDRRHRILVAFLAVPFLVGLLAAPAAAPGAAQGDELSRAQQQQKELQRKIANQKALIAQLNSSQASLAGAIAQTKDELAGITDNLVATRKRVTKLVANINKVKAEYQDLVTQLGDLDHQLGNIEAQETAKKAELGTRKAELADRIREAYEAERTSMLETFLSGASFTDMLAEMSTQLDAAEQDRALAAQIAEDRETLLALHQTVDDDPRPDERPAPGDRGPEAEARPAARRAQEGAGEAQEAREGRQGGARARRRRATRRWPRARPRSSGRSATTAAAKHKLEKRIKNLVARQYNLGNIPSRFNGTLRWPMAGTVTQPFGCTGDHLGAAVRQLRALPQRHRHRGAVRDRGARVGGRARRLHRLELRRRRRPGLDRDRRPLLEPHHLVRAHAAALPGARGPGRVRRARSSATRAARATRPAPTSTGWSSTTGSFVNPRLFT